MTTGVVTFLFTDIEGSTRLWEREPEAMRQSLARHHEILEAAVAANDGWVFKVVGDGVLAAFARPLDCVRTAVEAQLGLHAETWPEQTPIRVRMGLHTGPADRMQDDYVGPTLNRCARLVNLAHGGQILLSMATRQALSGSLPDAMTLRDLASHRLRDLAQPEHVFQLSHAWLPSEFPPLRSLDELPHNLPVRRSAFVGREREMARVKELLDEAALLTLTGTGGAGKTRLALQVAGDVVHRFPDGVWFIPLESLREPHLVEQRVALILGVAEEAGRSISESLVAYLRPRRLLLVLDNCEHLVEACAALAGALLVGCPTLKILATSREPLGIEAEVSWRVPLLAVPDEAPMVGLEGPELAAYVLQFASVRLFEARARSARAEFRVTAETARTVAELCRRLDGIPLAIELAAARVSAMSPEQILSRLDRRFGLLSAGRRDAVPRHQALRSLIDWSHDLLGEPEQVLLRRLAVFRGGWFLESAERVCGDDELPGDEVAECLTRLVSKSLVRVWDSDSGARYGFLATVLEYAWEKLAPSDDWQPVHLRLLDWCASLSRRTFDGLAGPTEAAWLGWFLVERDNVRAAVAWGTREAEAGRASPQTARRVLDLAGTSAYAWERVGLSSEGFARLTALLATEAAAEESAERSRALVGLARLGCRIGEYGRAAEAAAEGREIAARLADDALEADALQALAWSTQLQGGYDAARPLYELAMGMHERVGNRPAIAETLRYLGSAALEQGETAAARSCLERSLELRRLIGDRRGVAASLNALANLANDLADIDLAYARFFESLQISREVGDRAMQARVLSNLGSLAGQRGDLAGARPLLDESLRIKREHDDRRGVANTLQILGDIARMQGDLEAAVEHYRESLTMRRALGDSRGISESLEALAKVAWRSGRNRDAVRWLGAAAALREVIGSPVPPKDMADYDACADSARAALGDVAFGEIWLKGAAAAWAVAAAEALGESMAEVPTEQFGDGWPEEREGA